MIIKKSVWTLVALALLLAACGPGGATEGPAESRRAPDTSAAPAPKEPEEKPDAPPEPVERSRNPEGYRSLPRAGGRQHVVHTIEDSAYRPIDEYPQLLPFCREEMDEAEMVGATMQVDVAEYDINDDGHTDYLIRISTVLYGKLNPVQTLVLGGEDGALRAMDIGWTPPAVSIMDTTTNGLPDMAFRGFDYFPLYRYDGEGAYQMDWPAPLFVRQVLSNRESFSVEEGELVWESFNLWIEGAAPPLEQLPFYIGAVFDDLEGLVDGPLWARDGEGNAMRFFCKFMDMTLHFSADVLDEEALEKLLASEDHSVFPDEIIFVYVPGEAALFEPDGETLEYFAQAVPEYAAYRDQIVAESDGGARLETLFFPPGSRPGEEWNETHHLIMLLESRPDYSASWESFYVAVDHSEILWQGPFSGEAFELDRWRKSYRYRHPE